MPRPPSSNRGYPDPVSQVMSQHSALHYPANAGTILGAEIQAEATMAGSESKITSQGQISIPASIRKKLGLGPGSKVEWCERGDEVLIRRASKYSSQDIHDALFDAPTATHTVEEMDEGIRVHMRNQHARR